MLWSMSKSKKRRCKKASAETWALIRVAYLGGASAPDLAELLGVTVGAIRNRIWREGWSKRAWSQTLRARGVETKAASEAETARLSLAEDLEQRALAQAMAALHEGRANDAKTLAALAEQMRKRVEAERPAAVDEVLSDDERQALAAEMFARVARLAAAMVHAPASAPAVFLEMIKEWRRLNMGEGEADAEAAARRIGALQASFVNGDWAAGLPDLVRLQLDERWEALRTRGVAGAEVDLRSATAPR